jgi:hypothetical protein
MKQWFEYSSKDILDKFNILKPKKRYQKQYRIRLSEAERKVLIEEMNGTKNPTLLRLLNRLEHPKTGRPKKINIP